MWHRNELERCERYTSACLNPHDPPELISTRIPALVLGHTHEPRQHSRDPHSGGPPYYLNSGSAGRDENLLWCAEILPTEDRICSWSRVGSTLHKIGWRGRGAFLSYDAASSS